MGTTRGEAPARWVLVTGASSGIGEACARALLTQGFGVFGGVRSKRDAARLSALDPRLTPVQLEVTNPRSIAAAAAVIRKRCGRRGLDGLVNNAGVTLSAPLEFVPLAALRQLFEINLIGVVAVTQAMLPMLRAARGRIVNVGSLSGLVAAPFLGPYSASKAALEVLSDSLRMELTQWGIEVSLVEPGATATRIWEKSARSSARLRRSGPQAQRALYADAWGRFERALQRAGEQAGPVERVAGAVVHAVTDPAPATRYPLDDGETRRLRALPDRERDALLLRGLGLAGRRWD